MSYFYYQSKRIYYTETGSGRPLLFLHGNTASSRMFEFLKPLYAGRFHIILMDFLGHGQSDRVERFPADLWMEEANQTMALLEHLNLGKVNLVGTSGGAWAALNVALARPDLVDRVVADSFDGRTLGDNFAENLLEERTNAKKDKMSWFLPVVSGRGLAERSRYGYRSVNHVCQRAAPIICKTTV